MSRTRKYGRIALLVLVVLVGVQVAASFVVRTHRMRGFLIAHLESSFGRPMQADGFSMQILPVPELDMEGVTIGEDPAFGREYFLRAERMAAQLRWLGLLRGRFQFGTISFTRPSLILVRNAEGRWNLEGWLPPARPKSNAAAGPVGPQAPAESTHHLQKIEFDEGRINFKFGDEKRPFAFTNVSGSVEQVSPGRWRLSLEAEPWRSGVPLQSTGTLYVVGDVAGTSARLQPAQLQVHWGKVSVADLFRLATGNDSGVRGEFALDGTASVGMEKPVADTLKSIWHFQLQARATQLHRWDLTERSDNPRVNFNVKGVWDLAADQAVADELLVELPRSNLTGSAVLQTTAPAVWRAEFKDMNLRAEDLLAWYRAFQPGLDESVAVSDSITGAFSVSGWPLRCDQGSVEGKSGVLRIPGLQESRIEPFHGAARNGKVSVDGLRVKLGADVNAPQSKQHPPTVAEDLLEFNVNSDSALRQGSLKLNLHLADATRFFKLTAALGRRLDQGWEYHGGATGDFVWDWSGSVYNARRSGTVELSKSQLAIAGLNQPLKIDEARLEWSDGRRAATIARTEAFGASWTGTISELAQTGAATESNWRFQLHADHLDATELDLWFGPRSRPNWLQRLLASLLNESNTPGKASELLRRVSAEGELTADTLTIEKIKLAKAQAALTFHDLELHVTNAQGQWAGGTVQGQIDAKFSPVPHYDVTAEIERANLAQLPWPARWAERWSGTASGTVRVSTAGVGREELLKQLAGQGDIRLSKIELRGWDVRASTESGVARTGTSRWTSGEGRFEITDQEVRFPSIQLEGPQTRTELSGTLGFDMNGNVTFQPGSGGKHGTKIAQASRGLSLSGPLETPKVAVEPVSTETTRP